MSSRTLAAVLLTVLLLEPAVSEVHPPYGPPKRPPTPEQQRAMIACQVVIDSIWSKASDAVVSRQLDTTRGHLHLIWFGTAEHPVGSGDSLLAVYGGNDDYGFVGVFDARHPDSVRGYTDSLFGKNPMFDGGRIERVGDIVGDGYFEVLLLYFEGMQAEAMRLCRFDPIDGLIYLGRVQESGHTLDHFGGWFGVFCDDLDGDGIPEMIESTYGKNKSDRFQIIYKWNGSAFVEWRRER